MRVALRDCRARRTGGSARADPRAAAGRAARSAPRCACSNVSSDGVALPSTTGTPRSLGAPDGDVAPVIAHAILLLVRGVVLLVDDDERERAAAAQTPQGACRPRAPRPDPRPPANPSSRSPAARRLCSVASAGRAARAQALHELRRQVDLGDQQQHLAAAPAHARRRQIDLGLAAAGNAVQQERRKCTVRRHPIASIAADWSRRSPGPTARRRAAPAGLRSPHPRPRPDLRHGIPHVDHRHEQQDRPAVEQVEVGEGHRDQRPGHHLLEPHGDADDPADDAEVPVGELP